MAVFVAVTVEVRVPPVQVGVTVCDWVGVFVAVNIWVAEGVSVDVWHGTAKVIVEGIELAPEFQLVNSKTLEFWQA